MQSDSITLASFYQKLWTYETKREGKIKIVHIGDSHVQGGAWSGTARKAFNDKFGCGVTERGFIFPYRMAGSNGSVDYKVEYTGNWNGCRSAFVDQKCSWGLAGFSASSNSDSLSMKLWSKQGGEQNYLFDEYDLYAQFDTSSYELQVGIDSNLVTSFSYDNVTKIYHFELRESVDTLSVFFTRKTGSNSFKISPENRDSVVIQGMYLGNKQAGISYSEAAVNGGKVKSFLVSQYFLRQLKDISPDLLVLSLGTNDTYSAEYSDSAFRAQYGFLLYQIKKSIPDINIILTTPGDGQRYIRTHITENVNARKIIIELAQKYNCAVWDWYRIMGGSNSINEWHKQNLCAYDKLHLNNKGYELQGSLMYNAIMGQYESKVKDRRQEYYMINKGVNWKEFKEQFYLYSKDAPLLFNSPVFWLIFVAFFLVYLAVINQLKMRSVYLLLFSLFFYYKTGGWYFSLLIFSTVVDYCLGWFIGKSEKNALRRFWLITSVVVNLALLGFFKYSYFIVGEVNQYFGTDFEAVNIFYWISNEYLGSSFDIGKIVLPVGISFYTFQTMSYSIDIYRRKIEPLKNIFDFGFYVSFFPQLVAGPIVRASEFIPQIHKKYSLTKAQFAKASLLIMGGLIKKIIISDYIAVNLVDRIFDAPLRYSGFENILAIYGYALQIYCDFSAYSDIAIGLALLLGFTLPDNFNAPYSATSITEFWRRWHMTLSRWLRDYLYISLGGNRKGKIRTVVNLMLTMLIGGLWHGASIRFIIWGAMHGAGLVLHKVYIKLFPGLSSSNNIVWRFVSWMITFQFVAFCWVFFRATDMSAYFDMIGQVRTIFYNSSTGEWTTIGHFVEVIISLKKVLTIIAIGFVLHWIPKSWKMKAQAVLAKVPLFIYPVFVLLLALLLFQFSKVESSPFIYFQF